MTFREFQASRKWSDNLAKDAADYASYAEGPARRGFIYCDSLVIELVQDAPNASANNQWELIIGNEDQLSYDLTELEKHLFEYAEAEGIAPTLSDAEIKELADDALSAACKFIQDRLGQDDGGVAGHFFSGENRETVERVLSDYIKTELTYQA